MRLRIGTLVAEIEGWPGDPSPGSNLLDQFVLPDSETPPPDFAVRLSVGDAPRGSWKTSELQGVDVQRERRTVTVRMTEWTATFLLPERQVHAHLAGPWSLALESFLKTAVQLFALEAGTALLLHASAVERGGNAYVFAGHSGAGKTTAAMLSRHAGMARILREEMVFIGGLGGEEPPVVATLPIREKHMASAGPGSWPLAGVYWLEQAEVDVVERLSLSRATQRIVAVATIGVRDRMFMVPALDLSEELARRVQVKVLRFRRSAGFWDAIDAERETSQENG
jgi:hypothetical protein